MTIAWPSLAVMLVVTASAGGPGEPEASPSPALELNPRRTSDGPVAQPAGTEAAEGSPPAEPRAEPPPDEEAQPEPLTVYEAADAPSTSPGLDPIVAPPRQPSAPREPSVVGPAPSRALVISGSTLLGVAGVALGSAIALHVLAARWKRRYEDSFNHRGPSGYSDLTWAEALEYRRNAYHRGIGAAVGYAIAAVGVPVGAVLLATHARRKQDRLTVRPSISGRGAGIVLGWRHG